MSGNKRNAQRRLLQLIDSFERNVIGVNTLAQLVQETESLVKELCDVSDVNGCKLFECWMELEIIYALALEGRPNKLADSSKTELFDILAKIRKLIAQT